MKLKKVHRLAAISKILSDNPNKILTFNYFSEKFSAAKSTISSDISLIKVIFEDQKLGRVITVPGAAGGVKYLPTMYRDECIYFLILPGRFLYLIDLIYDPFVVEKIGKIFASVVDYSKADYLVTIETKGIPMAIMTARIMNLPLLIIRKNTKISEGPSINITYVTGKNNSKIQTMSLPIKSIKKGSKVIIIDDFMRGGGTIKGMHDLMSEFSVEVITSVVIISTKEPEIKKINNYQSLLILDEENNKNTIRTSKEILSKLSV